MLVLLHLSLIFAQVSSTIRGLYQAIASSLALGFDLCPGKLDNQTIASPLALKLLVLLHLSLIFAQVSSTIRGLYQAIASSLALGFDLCPGELDD